MKFAAQYKTFCFESEQRRVNFRLLQNDCICEVSDSNWSANLQATANQFANRIGAFPSLTVHRIRQNQFRLTNSVRIGPPEHRKSFPSDIKRFIRVGVLECADMS